MDSLTVSSPIRVVGPKLYLKLKCQNNTREMLDKYGKLDFLLLSNYVSLEVYFWNKQ